MNLHELIYFLILFLIYYIFYVINQFRKQTVLYKVWKLLVILTEIIIFKQYTLEESPTSIPKATNNGLKNIYNTMPRNQYANIIRQANNPENQMEDISGSISNGSGSVINSLINTNQETSIYKAPANITKIVKQVNF